MVKQRDEVSLRMFKWLLKQRGYQFWDENSLKNQNRIPLRTTRPDFYVTTFWCDFLAEVESFEKPSILDLNPNRVGTINPKDLLKRIAGAIKKAARQLKPYADLNLPMIVVLDNCRQVGIPLSPKDLIQLYGLFEFRGEEYNPEKGAIKRIRLFHGGKRQLGPNLHPYVSAVIVQIPIERYCNDDFSIERRMRARVLHNPYATTPLPCKVFSDKADTIISYSKSEGRWELLRQGKWMVSIPWDANTVKEWWEEDTWNGTRVVK